MVKLLFSYLLSLIFFASFAKAQSNHANQVGTPNKIITKHCITGDRISREWISAITPRMSKQQLDTVSSTIIQVSAEDREWIRLIESRANRWCTYVDSLETPFINCKIPDSVFIYLGHSGADDAFTFNDNTVCFDLTALQHNYGKATLVENSDRIDRLFSHELTHLIHKEWARVNNLRLTTFKDSVWWECIYEGFGMYRSLSSKWLPRDGVLPEITRKTLAELSPVFVDRLVEMETNENLDEKNKNRIGANLSRGPVNRKWGAFTVAIWLALEANGDDRNLRRCTEEGLNCVIYLARKYLSGPDKNKFESIFPVEPKR